MLGQASFTTNSAGTSQSALNKPMAMRVGGAYFWVADSGNARVLGFPLVPASGANAAFVLGQASFTTSATGRGLAQFQADFSDTLAVVNGDLVVGDPSNVRLMGFHLSGIASGQSAAWTISGSLRPRGLAEGTDPTDEWFFVADQGDGGSNRVIGAKKANL
ncbi:MAG: NHL repeat-containing protein, partial [Gemmataceae bacterium]